MRTWTVRILVDSEDVVYRDFKAKGAEDAVWQAAELAMDRDLSGFRSNCERDPRGPQKTDEAPSR